MAKPTHHNEWQTWHEDFVARLPLYESVTDGTAATGLTCARRMLNEYTIQRDLMAQDLNERRIVLTLSMTKLPEYLACKNDGERRLFTEQHFMGGHGVALANYRMLLGEHGWYVNECSRISVEIEAMRDRRRELELRVSMLQRGDGPTIA